MGKKKQQIKKSSNNKKASPKPKPVEQQQQQEDPNNPWKVNGNAGVSSLELSPNKWPSLGHARNKREEAVPGTRPVKVPVELGQEKEEGELSDSMETETEKICQQISPALEVIEEEKSEAASVVVHEFQDVPEFKNETKVSEQEKDLQENKEVNTSLQDDMSEILQRSLFTNSPYMKMLENSVRGKMINGELTFNERKTSFPPPYVPQQPPPNLPVRVPFRNYRNFPPPGLPRLDQRRPLAPMNIPPLPQAGRAPPFYWNSMEYVSRNEDQENDVQKLIELNRKTEQQKLSFKEEVNAILNKKFPLGEMQNKPKSEVKVVEKDAEVTGEQKTVDEVKNLTSKDEKLVINDAKETKKDGAQPTVAKNVPQESDVLLTEAEVEVRAREALLKGESIVFIAQPKREVAQLQKEVVAEKPVKETEVLLSEAEVEVRAKEAYLKGESIVFVAQPPKEARIEKKIVDEKPKDEPEVLLTKAEVEVRAKEALLKGERIVSFAQPRGPKSEKSKDVAFYAEPQAPLRKQEKSSVFMASPLRVDLSYFGGRKPEDKKKEHELQSTNLSSKWQNHATWLTSPLPPVREYNWSHWTSTSEPEVKKEKSTKQQNEEAAIWKKKYVQLLKKSEHLEMQFLQMQLSCLNQKKKNREERAKNRHLLKQLKEFGISVDVDEFDELEELVEDFDL